MTMYFQLLLLNICFYIYINGQVLQDAKTLHTDLLNGYMKDVLPNANESTPFEIDVYFMLFSLNTFQEVEEKLSVTAGINMNWNDPSLTWTPASYGGKEYIYFSSDLLWTPLLYLLNTPDKLKIVGGDSKYISKVSYNGAMEYTPGDVMEATCPADVSKFPFDIQTCTLDFVPWGFYATSVKLKSGLNNVILSYFTKNSDWSLESHSTTAEVVGVGLYSYKVKVSIKRAPTYYVVTVIIPTILFSLLNPLVFLLPVDSGERISLAMTILLSYAIFLTIVSGSVPATSNPMCFLLIMMIVIMTISGLIVIFAVITIKIYHEDRHAISKCSMIIIRLMGRRKTVPIEKSLPGKEMSKCLDRLFIIVSYVILTILILSYVIYVSV